MVCLHIFLKLCHIVFWAIVLARRCAYNAQRFWNCVTFYILGFAYNAQRIWNCVNFFFWAIVLARRCAYKAQPYMWTQGNTNQNVNSCFSIQLECSGHCQHFQKISRICRHSASKKISLQMIPTHLLIEKVHFGGFIRFYCGNMWFYCGKVWFYWEMHGFIAEM